MSITTRFPESRSFTTGDCRYLVEFEDQTRVCVASTRVRFPWLVIFRTPAFSANGASLLATHTTVWGVIFLYHIPKNWFVDLTGLKNPNSNLPAAETRLSPSLKSSPGLRLS
ncbi:hypothetical protein LINPERHAP1_LOCUS13230 [Linum perenne]